MPIASLSIDLDSIDCYHRIHGLPPLGVRDVAYLTGLKRFLSILAETKISGTLFAVGADLEQDDIAQGLKAAAKFGHEIGNHSLRHDYRLTRMQAHEVLDDLGCAHKRIVETTAFTPRGFRAPGYNTSEAVFDALEQLGYRYDSSIFPAPLYWGARALAIAYYRLRGQPSGSLSGDLRHFASTRHAYCPRRGALHRSSPPGPGRDLVELPIAVLPGLRLPLIGTSICASPEPALDVACRIALGSAAPIHIELHLVDFLDRSDPGISAELASRQRDLRIPYAIKRRRLLRVVRHIAARRPFERLDRCLQS